MNPLIRNLLIALAIPFLSSCAWVVPDTGTAGVSLVNSLIAVTVADNGGTAGTTLPGQIYVTDSGRLYRFDDMAGTNQVEYDGSAGTTFTSPQGIAFDSSGRIYVAENGILHRFDDMSGTNHTTYNGLAGGTQFTQVKDVFIDSNDLIYLCDNSNSLVYRFDDMSGTNQMELSVSAQNPQGIVVDSAGRIYITMTFAVPGRVDRYDGIAGGGLVSYTGSVGTSFDRPHNIALDASERIYTVTFQGSNDIVYRFDDMSGTGHVEYAGTMGTPFAAPRGLHVDSTGRILITDNSTNLLYRIDDMNGNGNIEYDGTTGGGTMFSGQVYVNVR